MLLYNVIFVYQEGPTSGMLHVSQSFLPILDGLRIENKKYQQKGDLRNSISRHFANFPQSETIKTLYIIRLTPCNFRIRLCRALSQSHEI